MSLIPRSLLRVFSFCQNDWNNLNGLNVLNGQFYNYIVNFRYNCGKRRGNRLTSAKTS